MAGVGCLLYLVNGIILIERSGQGETWWEAFITIFTGEKLNKNAQAAGIISILISLLYAVDTYLSYKMFKTLKIRRNQIV